MPSVSSLGSGNICLKLKSDSQGAFNLHHKRPSHWARSSPCSKISPSMAQIRAAGSLPALPPLRSPAAASLLLSLPTSTASPKGQSGLPNSCRLLPPRSAPGAVAPSPGRDPSPEPPSWAPGRVRRAPRESSPVSPHPRRQLFQGVTLPRRRLPPPPRAPLPGRSLSSVTYPDPFFSGSNIPGFSCLTPGPLSLAYSSQMGARRPPGRPSDKLPAPTPGGRSPLTLMPLQGFGGAGHSFSAWSILPSAYCLTPTPPYVFRTPHPAQTHLGYLPPSGFSHRAHTSPTRAQAQPGWLLSPIPPCNGALACHLHSGSQHRVWPRVGAQ